MTKDIESSTHNMPSTSPKSALRTGFPDEGFYDNFTLLIDNEPAAGWVDLDDDLIGDDSNFEISSFMDQCAKDYDISFELLSCQDDRVSDICRKSGSSPEASDKMDC